MEYRKGARLSEGKTKIVWKVKDRAEKVIIENKNDITAFDDPSFTKQFKTKAAYATMVTCRVFELLEKAGVPVAYEQQIADNQFVASNCSMIPLEVVARRFAVGSFLKRHPELVTDEGIVPKRFHGVAVEFFLKTTKGKLVNHKGETVLSGLDPKKGEEDPLIVNPFEKDWRLFHPKKPNWEETADLGRTLKTSKILPSRSSEMMREMEVLMRKTFLVLEGAWNTLGYRLIDMKIEFGVDKKGKLMVADVIDNDSWRLRDAKWQELSKEAFRQGEKLDEVEKKYGFVADLAQRFILPQQAIVLWRGSDSDDFPDMSFLGSSQGIVVEEVTLSGHKSTQKCLKKLGDIMTRFPEGGVIIACVGMSNGLGPILAARTGWPVIGVPMTAEKFPEDVWSSLRVPSQVPMATVLSGKNAVLLACNILAQKNPVAYAIRQMSIEALDA
ncbi:MAG: phosphoribosylaminoimidazolesuccinocarboxamide synthase [Patescibacteria group bacterium]